MVRNQKKLRLSTIILFLLIFTGMIFAGAKNKSTEVTASAHSQAPENGHQTTETVAEKEQSGRMTVHFLDVGQGLSVLMESDGHYVIYDGGGPERSSYVVAYLKKQGIKDLDYLVASHYDMDHISGLVGVANVFSAKTLLGPDYEGDTDIYRSFIETAEKKGEVIVHPMVGDSYYFGSAKMEFLAPLEKYADPNECSLVAKVTCKEASMLLTGDAANQSENAMIAAEKDLLADLLVVGHHGSDASTSEEFLKKVNPDYAVVSCGSENKFRHPAQGTMDRLKNRDLDMYRTDLQGTVKAVFDNGDITWDKEPSKDYTGRDVDEKPEAKSAEMGKQYDNSLSAEYVLNTNTLKFHKPFCHSVDKISPENRSDFTGTREEAIAMGYTSCGNCKP